MRPHNCLVSPAGTAASLHPSETCHRPLVRWGTIWEDRVAPPPPLGGWSQRPPDWINTSWVQKWAGCHFGPLHRWVLTNRVFWMTVSLCVSGNQLRWRIADVCLKSVWFLFDLFDSQFFELFKRLHQQFSLPQGILYFAQTTFNVAQHACVTRAKERGGSGHVWLIVLIFAL